jgi:hypothetical protein
MPNRTTIVLTLFAITVGIVGAAFKIGGFTNVAVAWGMIGLAGAIAVFAAWLWIQPIYKRIIVRSPFRLLPPHFSSEHIYTVDKLEAEFIRFREAYEDADGSFRMLREVYDFNEQVARKDTRNIFDMGPHSYRIERTTSDQYIVAKRNLWNALNEFIEIYRRLT